MAAKLFAHHCAAWLTAAVIVAAIELQPMQREDPGCVTAVVTRVIDGDTFVAQIELPLDVTLRNQHIRIRGVDAPELDADDPAERARAEAATQWLRRKLKWQRVRLAVHGRDSFGRVLADVQLDGTDIAQELVKEELATPWRP